MSKSDMKRRNALAGRDMMEGVGERQTALLDLYGNGYPVEVVELKSDERIISVELIEELLGSLTTHAEMLMPFDREASEYELRTVDKLRAVRNPPEKT